MKTEAVPHVGVIDALASGLSMAARRPWLLIVPVVSELFLWLAPQISVAELLQRFMFLWEGLLRATYSADQMVGMSDMITALREGAAQLGSSFNVAEGITGGWLGVPSVLSAAQATRMTFITDLVLTPAGLCLQIARMAPSAWRAAPIQITNVWTLLLILLGFWLVGLVLATLYLRWVAASWQGAKASQYWSGIAGFCRLAGRMVLFSVVLGAVILVLRLPLAFALTLLWLSSSSALGVLMLLFGGVALWLTLWFMLSLFFVNEAILLDHQPVWRGIVQSIVLVHNNFWPTMGLCLVVNLLLYGFRVIWELLGHSAFGAGLAIVGNAYLSTGMLLAIFVFYENLSRRAMTRRMVTGKQ